MSETPEEVVEQPIDTRISGSKIEKKLKIKQVLVKHLLNFLRVQSTSLKNLKSKMMKL